MSSKKFLLVVTSPLKENTKAAIKPYVGAWEYDIAYLSSQPKEKILKGDVDLEVKVFDD